MIDDFISLCSLLYFKENFRKNWFANFKTKILGSKCFAFCTMAGDKEKVYCMRNKISCSRKHTVGASRIEMKTDNLRMIKEV